MASNLPFTIALLTINILHLTGKYSFSSAKFENSKKKMSSIFGAQVV